jgi:hypothetical protein
MLGVLGFSVTREKDVVHPTYWEGKQYDYDSYVLVGSRKA